MFSSIQRSISSSERDVESNSSRKGCLSLKSLLRMLKMLSSTSRFSSRFTDLLSVKKYESRSFIAALKSPWDFIASCFRNWGDFWTFSFSQILESSETIVPMFSGFISTSFDFARTGESFDCQMSLHVIMSGNFVCWIVFKSSGIPPLSVPVTPSTSSMRIILLFLNRDFCNDAGLRISSSFVLFLKSEEFNSKISRLFSFAAEITNDVLPVPAGP